MASPLTLRKRARVFAMQALYQWALTDNPPTDIQAHTLAHQDPKRYDVIYFNEVFLGAVAEVNQLDTLILDNTQRELSEITPIECAILRLAVYELLHRPEVPYKVVINEALEISKNYGANDAYKFVNGILDKVAKAHRTLEM